MALHECHHGSVKRTHTTILHRDIKPENGEDVQKSVSETLSHAMYLVFLDSNQNAKLGDFGLSKVVDHPENEFAKTYVG